MQKRKIAALLLVSLLAATGFAGCSGSKPATAPPAATASAADTPTAAPSPVSGPDTSKAVELVMYLVGDTSPGVPAVYDQVNQKMKADINATITVNFLGWDDFNNKYDLLLASGEALDMMYAANWMNFDANARKGAFWEITPEALAKYAPKTAAGCPAEVLDSGRIDGKLYALPADLQDYYTLCYVVRGDLMKKYGITSISSLDEFGAFLGAVAGGETGIIPYNVKGDNWQLSAINMNEQNISAQGTQGMVFNMSDPAMKGMAFFDQPNALQYDLKMRDWQQKGYWSKNALANTVDEKESFLAGTSAACLLNLKDANTVYMQLAASNPDWNVQVFNAYNKNSASVAAYINNAMAISYNSKNPERALMALDLLKNDQWYNTITHYGIEGTDYTVNADGTLQEADGASYPADGPCPWGWNNKAFVREFNNMFGGYYTIMQQYQANFKPNPLQNFSLDATKPTISSIVPVLTDLQKQYGQPLALGFMDNTESSFNEYVNKMKAAGFDTYMAEVQAQIDAYLAAQPK